jgi:hypothetical protein
MVGSLTALISVLQSQAMLEVVSMAQDFYIGTEVNYR